jgi:hypothetical protein
MHEKPLRTTMACMSGAAFMKAIIKCYNTISYDSIPWPTKNSSTVMVG